MDARELRALRKTRKLSQRAAALDWGVTPTSIWRWEHEQRPVPMWVERMIERERPLLKRIEAQEKEIAALLLKIHRMPDSRPERLPMAVVRLGARTGAVRGGRRARA